MTTTMKLRLVSRATVTLRLVPRSTMVARVLPGVQGPQGDPGDTFPEAAIEFVADGGGLGLTTGLKGFLEVPFACTVTAARMFADTAGSIVVDVWKCTYAQFDGGVTHPVIGDTITSATPPTITASTKSQDTTLTGWTTTLTAGDVLGFNITSVSSITRATLSLDLTRT